MISGNLNVSYDRYLSIPNHSIAETIEKSLARISTDVVEFRISVPVKLGTLKSIIKDLEKIQDVYKSANKRFGLVIDIGHIIDMTHFKGIDDVIDMIKNSELDIAIFMSKYINTKALSVIFADKNVDGDICVIREYSYYASPQSILEDIKVLKPHRINLPYNSVHDINFIRYLVKNKIAVELCPTELYKNNFYSNFRALYSHINNMKAEGVRFVIKSDFDYITNISNNLENEYDGLPIDMIDVTDLTFIDKKIQNFINS